LDLRKLAHFVALAEALNFMHAAERRHMTAGAERVDSAARA
jgi:DNA-binding transcriptional LysR family regulator